MAPGDPPAVRALFQRRIAGDAALLGLAQLRFRQAGMAAELYADDPKELEYILRFVPESDLLPTVHLDRRIDVLTTEGRDAVMVFRQRFAGRIAGVIVHDQPVMNEHLDATAEALRKIVDGSSAATRPVVFLEYAGGFDPEQFVALAELLNDVEHASVCVDIGHVGIGHARTEISRRLGPAPLPTIYDPELAVAIEPLGEAIASALHVVTSMIDSLGAIDKPVHIHLHDGHPLTSGLADHRSFLAQVPVPFRVGGRYSIPQLYGPSGLATILRHAQRMRAQPSYTLEIHQAEGRLPLLDALPMFAHWVDLTNAERMNYWLAVVAENHLLTSELLHWLANQDHDDARMRGRS
jgi:hypothetical protein